MTIHFFWASGTANLLAFFGAPVGAIPTGAAPTTVYGLNGQSVQWDGWPGTDPFPTFLDPNIWTVRTVNYPAAIFPAWDSIQTGVTELENMITALPAGTPFCLGGYSQGAAVCSLILGKLQAGELGPTRLADMKAATMFGNPCRKENWTWPAWGGYPGGLFSGAWDIAGSTTGGRGAFPANLRLTNPPERWFEFVGGRTDQYDPVNSTGNSPFGIAMTDIAGQTLGLPLQDIINLGVGAVSAIYAFLTFKGHGAYATQPPPGYAADAPTSYQIALSYLNSVAAQFATAPLVLPPASPTAGWSTSLIPPAA